MVASRAQSPRPKGASIRHEGIQESFDLGALRVGDTTPRSAKHRETTFDRSRSMPGAVDAAGIRFDSPPASPTASTTELRPAPVLSPRKHRFDVASTKRQPGHGSKRTTGTPGVMACRPCPRSLIRKALAHPSTLRRLTRPNSFCTTQKDLASGAQSPAGPCDHAAARAAARAAQADRGAAAAARAAYVRQAAAAPARGNAARQLCDQDGRGVSAILLAYPRGGDRPLATAAR